MPRPCRTSSKCPICVRPQSLRGGFRMRKIPPHYGTTLLGLVTELFFWIGKPQATRSGPRQPRRPCALRTLRDAISCATLWTRSPCGSLSPLWCCSPRTPSRCACATSASRRFACTLPRYHPKTRTGAKFCCFLAISGVRNAWTPTPRKRIRAQCVHAKE